MTIKIQKYMRLFLLTIGLSLCFSGMSLFAQSSAGLTFLRMTVGSRAQAMGDAYTAIAENANGFYYNPAGMGFGTNRELLLFHSQWFEDIAVENMTFFFPFTSRLSVAAGFSYLHTGELTRYDIDQNGGPVEDGTFSVYDMVAMAGIGYRVSDYVSVGTNFKFFRESLETVSANGIAFDLGLLTKIPSVGVSFGFSVQHLGPGVTYIEATENLPLTYRFGAALRLPEAMQGSIAFDVVKTKGQETQFHPGLELGLMNSFYVRGGYQLEERAGNGVTAGFGLRLADQHKVNYVYVPYGDLGDTHRAELVFNLGKPHTRTSLARNNPDTDSDKRAREIINRPAGNTEIKPSPTPKEPVATVQDNRLASPTGLKAEHIQDHKMILTWDQLPVDNVRYLVYARQVSSSKWIKVTPKPITATTQVFNPKKRGLKLQFVVTAVVGEKESDFSQPVYFELP